jgi:hypothetical protein
MKKGWQGLQQGFCAAHTGELTANIFIDYPPVKAMVAKLKGKQE